MVLSYFGPSECHLNSLNEYAAASTDENRKRRLNKHDDITPHGTEMISFIQPTDADEKVQKDSN